MYMYISTSYMALMHKTNNYVPIQEVSKQSAKAAGTLVYPRKDDGFPQQDINSTNTANYQADNPNER